MSDHSIILNNIKKTYNKGTLTAVKDISFTVNSGELFGLIGPDGAGKTTLFRILTTLLLADEGTAMVNGFDVVKNYKDIRNCVGYMPGKFSLYQDLTIEENLNFFATVFGTTIEKNYDLSVSHCFKTGYVKKLMNSRQTLHFPLKSNSYINSLLYEFFSPISLCSVNKTISALFQSIDY